MFPHHSPLFRENSSTCYVEDKDHAKLNRDEENILHFFKSINSGAKNYYVFSLFLFTIQIYTSSSTFKLILCLIQVMQHNLIFIQLAPTMAVINFVVQEIIFIPKKININLSPFQFQIFCMLKWPKKE